MDNGRGQKLIPTNNLFYARDGSVVLFKRGSGRFWQARFKLPDQRWHRISTKHTDIGYAKSFACDKYDEARFLFKHDLPLETRRFADVANLTIAEMEKELSAGHGKSVYHTYISVIKIHLTPYFGKKHIDRISYQEVNDFYDHQQNKLSKPIKASTISNYNSALNRIYEFAMMRGWVVKSQVPQLRNRGAAGERRPAFTMDEWILIARKLRDWTKIGHRLTTLEMRELLRDYVLILGNTGIRHGTETANLKWKHIRWYIDRSGHRYIQMSVDGKTGRRDLIARHNVVNYLKRIQSHFPDLAQFSFDELLKRQVDEYVFRFRSGGRTNHLNQSFRQFLKRYGLLADKFGDNRTLYSLRHTYATLALVGSDIGIHDLATQMGTSVAMIEQHYSHLTPAMKAKTFA
jgi:integrase